MLKVVKSLLAFKTGYKFICIQKNELGDKKHKEKITLKNWIVQKNSKSRKKERYKRGRQKTKMTCITIGSVTMCLSSSVCLYNEKNITR